MIKQQQRGFGLIEILVALLVVAIGLLGTITLHTRASQAELESYQRVQAMLLMEDIVNRMSANRRNRACYALNRYGLNNIGTGVDIVVGDVNSCDAMTGDDLVAWHGMLLGRSAVMNGNNVGAMVGARGCIEQIADRQYRVTIAWQGMQATVAPDVALDCGAGAYGAEDQRRVMTRFVEFADLD